MFTLLPLQTVTLSEAQLHLDDWVSKLFPNLEIVITNGEPPVARWLPFGGERVPRPVREFAGQFKPLPASEKASLRVHDSEWCGPVP